MGVSAASLFVNSLQFLSLLFTPRILFSVYFRAMTLFMRLVFALLEIRSVKGLILNMGY